MPNCFQLYKNGEDEPAVLQEVDNDLWNHFEGAVPEPNDKWYMDWYNTVGLSLAMGQNWDEIRGYCLTDRARAVVDYLAANYTPSAFYSSRK